MQKPVRIDRNGQIATVVLERPAARNAVDPDTAALLAQAFIDIDRDDTVEAAVLWGAGGTFCAGADLRAVAAGWNPAAGSGTGRGRSSTPISTLGCWAISRPRRR